MTELDMNGPRAVNGKMVGLRRPTNHRNVDRFGFEMTHHALRFRGSDWDLVLSKKRIELTDALILDASLATAQPASNISNVRFLLEGAGGAQVDNDSDPNAAPAAGVVALVAKFDVRHKAFENKQSVQDKLALFPYHEVKALYEPREKKPRPAGWKKEHEREPIKHRQTSAVLDEGEEFPHRQMSNVSFFGRVNVDEKGPAFKDEEENEEILIPPHEVSKGEQLFSNLAGGPHRP